MKSEAMIMERFRKKLKPEAMLTGSFRKKLKAQMGLMEYIVMTFFIILVIVVIIFFLMGFQISQFTLEKKGSAVDRALSLTKQVSSSPLFVKSEGVFDDGKLTSLKTMGNICPQLEGLFGQDWFFEVTVLEDSDVITPCTQSSYPDCNHWSFCTKDQNSIAFDLPVNVYRNIGKIVSTGVLPRTDIALLKVGIYVE